MKKNIILFILFLFGGLSISQCSLNNGGQEYINGPHIDFLVFDEHEVQIKSLKLNNNFKDEWWQDFLFITKTSDQHLAISPGFASYIIGSLDLNFISDNSFPYADNQLGPWFKVIKLKDTIRWDEAVSDSVVTSLTIQKFITEDPLHPSFEKVFEIHSERPSQERFLEKTISSYRNNFMGYELHGYNVINKMVKDSLGVRLSMNPYYHALNMIHIPEIDNNSIKVDKIDHVPSLDIPFNHYAGTLNNQFSFVSDYSRNLLVFDSHAGSWHSVGTRVRPFYSFINTNTAVTDSSLAFVSQYGLSTYNPYTKKLEELHPFEVTTEDAVVQYDEQTKKLLLIYHYRESDGITYTGREVVKVYSFTSSGHKTEIFSKVYNNSESTISNFIKVDGTYFAIIKKQS